MNLVYSYFVLDIVHRGHLMMLKNSKAIAGPEGRLIVGIVSDEAVLDKKGNNIISKINAGDRFYTPHGELEKSKKIKTTFNSKGLKKKY